ncbi:hypothetical protein BJX61DRAFT_184164 [Aspergillus egyptiacus]|nr:hypothetical protein BJX61DRAFT_184164 [Aspergillus egyptiacus]
MTTNPTARSAKLLQSLSPEILQIIFRYLLQDEVYDAHTITHIRPESLRTISMRYLVSGTCHIRQVCSYWSRVIHSLVFSGKGIRNGLVVTLPRLLTQSEKETTFPVLRDCLVERLANPYSFQKMFALQQRLENPPASLEYVCAIRWDYDHHEQNEIFGPRSKWKGYGTYWEQLKDVFTKECFVAGFPMADDSKLPDRYPCLLGVKGTGKGSSVIAPEYMQEQSVNIFYEDMLDILRGFMVKECLALWYYNAQIFWQIADAFPNLEYLECPLFLHLPMVAKKEQLFPRNQEHKHEQPDDWSPCVQMKMYPPRLLKKLELDYGHTYRERGGCYEATMRRVQLLPVERKRNPILALQGFLISNKARFGDCIYKCWELPNHFVQDIEHRVQDAVLEIPEQSWKSTPWLDRDTLYGVMSNVHLHYPQVPSTMLSNLALWY